jgi:2'-5' RNA ligase
VRLFFALPLPDEALDALEEARRSFLAAGGNGADARAAATFGRARWSPRANLHLTLAFLGEYDQAGLAAALAAGDEAFGPGETAPGSGLALKLEGWGAFPRLGAATVLWAGLGRSPGLLAVAVRLRTALDRAGLRYDRSPLKPHLTLARFSKPTELRGLPPDTVPGVGFQAQIVALYRSVLGGGPPRYEALGTWRL